MILQTYLIAIVNYLGFSSFHGSQQDSLQYPLQYKDADIVHTIPKTLSFVPPGAAESAQAEPFTCQYPAMADEYTYNDSGGNRSVWLKHRTNSSMDFDIDTDYETRRPIGIERKYILIMGERALNLDGIEFPYAKVVNGSFPGPWIQACWGDKINITVKNNLCKNGTAIHMHGLRMLDNGLMDGVPGITQCPIAPGDTFNYVFNTTQYGTTWYHSHYSLQYSDGVLGPLTIHGPTSADYDKAIDPIIFTDHNHRSAFQEYYQEQFATANLSRVPPKQTSILLNGHGIYAGSFPHRRYNKKVKPGKRYILRVINGSTDTTFIFSIDGHNLTVVGMDLVPVRPFTTDHLYIGRGQRYHVVLETKTELDDSENGAYWIRTDPADGCHNFETFPDARQGILWYEGGYPPIPTTNAHPYNNTCSDMLDLEPIIPWTVDQPPPITPLGDDPQVTVNSWKFLNDTLRVNYELPTVNHLDPPYNKSEVIYLAALGQPAETTWNYMLLIGGNTDNPRPVTGGALAPVAHPIHLHGHDFAVLQYSTDKYNSSENLNFTLQNPRRRDAVLLPLNGFIVIAFKTDNPGAWTLHCHIAWHASAGLAFQVLEEGDVFKTHIEDSSIARNQLDRTSQNWQTWFANKTNRWNPNGRFQDDSGI
ncbi:multicopper oxidase [Aspergillus carbonarius ITEM 5010]|uniref:Multicopper oxidase n=1 Tax=Aspergillus carbonarius (strain ITEM 5010) TaxID=602072 RepID=A0A1R3RQI4_ASPC5|nr:multicopper oxidase [Aspergillus carbonarius ITEM 5010]